MVIKANNRLHRSADKSGRREIGGRVGPISLEPQVRLLIDEAENALRPIGKTVASGDPDLFIYNKSRQDRFFVEVKENDHMTDNQSILFPLIQKLLGPVFTTRVSAKVPF